MNGRPPVKSIVFESGDNDVIRNTYDVIRSFLSKGHALGIFFQKLSSLHDSLRAADLSSKNLIIPSPGIQSQQKQSSRLPHRRNKFRTSPTSSPSLWSPISFSGGYVRGCREERARFGVSSTFDYTNYLTTDFLFFLESFRERALSIWARTVVGQEARESFFTHCFVNHY